MRFAQMAGVLLTTAGLAVVSMTFALHDAVRAPLLTSVALGLLWGLVILNLDRFLVLSMGRVHSRGRQVLMALPRLALVLVLALVISTPLVLRVFASDINAQLYVMQLEESRAQQTLIAHSYVQQEANTLQGEINQDEAVLAGHLPVSVTSPQLQTAQATVSRLQPQVQAAYQTVNTARETWQCQLYGDTCAGASGAAGNGPVAEADQEIFQNASASYNTIAAQLKSAQDSEDSAAASVRASQASVLAADQTHARAALPELRSRYQQLSSVIQQNIARGSAVAAANTGLLAQLQALSEVTAHNSSLGAARSAVLLVFLLIEILPVTVKFLLNLGPPSAYEAVAQLRDDELVDSVRARQAEIRRIESAKSQTRISTMDMALQEYSDAHAKLASAGRGRTTVLQSPGDLPPDS